LLWLGLVVLSLFTGVCSIFVLIVTVAQGWQEHAQAQWPGGDGARSEMRGGYLHAQA
jgi:hypothetical protein